VATPADRVVIVLTIGIILLSATAVFGAFDTSTGDQVSAVDRTGGVVPLDGTEWATIADNNGENETVMETRGNAVQLNGAPDSEVRSDADLSLATDGNWTVCTWARARDTTAEMDVLSANGRIVLGYNGTATEWTLWYYDDASTSSWQLNASATTPGQGFYQLCAWQSNDELRFYINATRRDRVANVSKANIREAPVNTSNWNGTVEETRVFDDALDASQRNATVSDPTAALPSANRSARVMYDAGSGSRVYVWFNGTDATLSNGSWVSGFDRVTVPESGYEWRRDGPEIRATSGSILDGAPVAWVDYDRYSSTGTAYERFFGQWTDAATMAGVVMLVVIVAGILAGVQRMNDM